MDTETPQTNSSTKRLEILKELKRLALRRGAEPSKEALEVFADDLMPYQLEDIQEALYAIGALEIDNFSKRWPEIGFFKRAIEKHRISRQSADSRIAPCQNRDCIQGMVRVWDDGFCTGVKACQLCGGPSWFKASLDHNFFLLKENGLIR